MSRRTAGTTTPNPIPLNAEEARDLTDRIKFALAYRPARPRVKRPIDPERPADLYKCFDTDGTLLYVGISFQAAMRVSAHRSGKGWWPDVCRIEVEHFPTRAAARAAELKAIRTDAPHYNKEGRRGE